MGSLIQTKGTQRLAKLFNSRFGNSATGFAATQLATSTAGSLPNVFGDARLDLLAISDAFIAQYAVSNWPADGNDLLYPSATMITNNTTAMPATNVLSFTLPAGIAALPGPGSGWSIAPGSAVCSLDFRKTIPPGTVVGAVNPGAGGNFTVTLVDKAAPHPNNVPVTVSKNGERISFALGTHEQLVRRWRWYLKYDLATENHGSIRRPISFALSDVDFAFKKITFQTVEDTQKVLVTTQKHLKDNEEFDDAFEMHIVLVTQATTAPDPLDPQ